MLQAVHLSMKSLVDKYSVISFFNFRSYGHIFYNPFFLSAGFGLMTLSLNFPYRGLPQIFLQSEAQI